MNITATSPRLDCGHKPAPHSYWNGNANRNDETGKVTCFKCCADAGEIARRSDILDCGHTAAPSKYDWTSGMGHLTVDGKDTRHCYECCAVTDLELMRDTGKNTMYFSKNSSGMETDTNGQRTPSEGYHVSNWPGNITFSAYYKKGYHNMAGTRYDYWFHVGGQQWYGHTIGENTQIAHCKRVKGEAAGPSYKCLIDALLKTAVARTRKDTRRAAK